MKKTSLILLTFLLVITSSYHSQAGEQGELDYEAPLCNGFKTINSFGELKVSFQGTAEQIGLDKDRLTAHLRSSFAKSFAGINFQKTDNLYQASKDAATAPTIGYIDVEVWTVGENDPIAYHVTLFAGNLTDISEYARGNLGFDTRENIPGIAEATITKFTADMATDFFKARAELP